jgi:hypothetical protein
VVYILGLSSDTKPIIMDRIMSSFYSCHPSNLTILTWSGMCGGNFFKFSFITDKVATPEFIIQIQNNIATALETMPHIVDDIISAISTILNNLTCKEKNLWKNNKIMPQTVCEQFSKSLSPILNIDAVVDIIIENFENFVPTNFDKNDISKLISNILMEHAFGFLFIGCYTPDPLTHGTIWTTNNSDQFDTCAQFVRNTQPDVKPFRGMLYASCLDS